STSTREGAQRSPGARRFLCSMLDRSIRDRGQLTGIRGRGGLFHRESESLRRSVDLRLKTATDQAQQFLLAVAGLERREDLLRDRLSEGDADSRRADKPCSLRKGSVGPRDPDRNHRNFGPAQKRQKSRFDPSD